MMKKITLMLFFLMATFTFAQELVTNGDFQTGSATPWGGNAANAVDLGAGEFVNQADIATAGNPWDVNLSQVLSLTAGTSYTFSFDAWTDTATGTRTIIAGIGLNEDPWTAVTETVTLTDASQTFTYTMVAPVTSANNRVLFDMGANAGFVFIDNVSLMEVMPTCTDGIQNGDETGVDCGGTACSACPVSGPTVAAPTPPARAAADVVSIFSDAYTNVSVNAWGPDWGPSSARINDLMVDGNATKEVDIQANQVFAGIDFSSAAFDATSFTHYHVDYYIESPLPTGQVFNNKLSNHDGGAGETSAIQDTQTTIPTDQWIQLDIPLDDFVGANAPPNLDRNAIAQIVITAARANNSDPIKIYLDNIYFHKNTVLGIGDNQLANFNVFPNPSKNGWNVQTENIAINTIEVFDVLGKQVLNLQPNSNKVFIDNAGLNKGIYFANVNTASGIKTIKLIKK